MSAGATSLNQQSRPHVCGTPSKYRTAGITGSAEFRFPKVLMGMQGLEFADREGVDASYRAQLDKSRLLRYVTPIIAGAAIQRDGLDRTQLIRRTHSELASMMGYGWRESYTRNGAKAPHMVTRNVKKLVKGSVYSFSFSEGKRSYGPDDYTMPTARELRENDQWKHYWKQARKAYKGYFWVPAWIFHPCTPGTPYQKLVLLALAFFGLFSMDENGHCDGELQMELVAIAATVGLSRDAVRSALAFWQKEGILQVKEHDGRWELNGQEVKAGTPGACWRQPPNTIYYVAAREFNEESAQRETERFLAAATPIRDTYWFEAIAGIHSAALREWMGTRQLIKTFYAEFRRRLEVANVPAQFIGRVIPPPPQ